MEAQPQQQATLRPPQKPRAFDPVVIAAFVLVVLFTVIVSSSWILLSGSPPKSLRLTTPFEPGMYNWTLIVSGVSGGPFTLDSVTMTIYDRNGDVKLPGTKLTQLTIENWETYHVAYLRFGSETIVVVNARVFVDKTAYPAGCKYEMSDATAILATGIFQ